MSVSVKVAIVDDHPLVLCGLRKLLEDAGCQVIWVERGASKVIAMLDKSECDVLLVDYSMPGEQELDGWPLLASITTAFPRLPLLVYSESDDPFLIGSLVKRGISGVVTKREEMSEIASAVYYVALGRRYLSPLAERAVERFNAAPETKRFATLTQRQMEVTGLMLCGLSICEAARLLRLGTKTISLRRVEACRRLGFSGVSKMFNFATDHGLRLDRASDGDGYEYRHA